MTHSITIVENKNSVGDCCREQGTNHAPPLNEEKVENNIQHSIEDEYPRRCLHTAVSLSVEEPHL